MKSRRAATAAILGIVLTLFAAGAAFWRGSVALADVAGAVTPANTVVASPLSVQLWPSCDAWRGTAPTTKLCTGPDEDIRTTAFRFLSGQLDRTVRHVSALCEIDDVVVQAYNDCTIYGLPHNVFVIGSLTEQLAENWERHGALRRADLLYEQAYAIYGLKTATEFSLFLKMHLAARWMRLKLRLGDHHGAKELAYVQAELARWRHDMGRSTNAHLVEALEWLAEILDEVGEVAAASAIRSEAEALAAAPTRCAFYCDLERDGTITGVREKR